MSQHGEFPPNLLFPSSSGNKSNPAIIKHANKILAAARKPVEVPRCRQHDWENVSLERNKIRCRKPSPFSKRVQSILDAAALVASSTDTHILYKAVAEHGAAMLDNRERIDSDNRTTEVNLFLIDPLDDEQLISETSSKIFKIGEGIIGYVASTKRVLNMAIGDLPDHPTNHLNVRKADDAFNPDEFWMSFEGDPTRDVLCVPIFQTPTKVLGVLHAQRPSIRAHFRREKSREGGRRGRRRSPTKRGGGGAKRVEPVSNGLSAKKRAANPPYQLELEEAAVQLARLVAAAVLQCNADSGESYVRQAQRFRAQKMKKHVMKVLERGTRDAKHRRLNVITDDLFRAKEKIQTLERAVEEEQHNLVAMNKLMDGVKEEKGEVEREKNHMQREFDLLTAKWKLCLTESNQNKAKVTMMERHNEMYKEQLENYRAPKDVAEIERLNKYVATLQRDLLGAESAKKMESAKRMIARFVLRNVARAFNAWSATVKEIRRQKDQCRRIIARIMNRLIGATFDAWIQYTEEEKRLRGLLDRAARSMKNRQVAGGFRSWLEYVDLRLWLKDFCTKMIARHEQKEIAKGMNKWIQVFNDERRSEFELGNEDDSKVCVLL
jgi:hypothetical protein